MSRTPLLIHVSRRIFIAYLFISYCFFGIAQNPIVTENALPGNPSSEWDITGAGDLSIQGFGTELSINTGGTIHFKIDVKAPSTNYSIKIYRLGYYGGNGARLVADLGNTFTGIAQPAPLFDVATAKVDCSNWAESAAWTASGAVSGIYIALLTRNDDPDKKSHIAFVVRDDSRNAPILFKTSDATWQAYNGYGNNSLYPTTLGTPPPGFNHATKVSYNRPFYTRSGGGGDPDGNSWLFNAEYPMIRWMERNGYDLSYATQIDMAKNIVPITPAIHKILLSVGHDEYWSAAERTNFETARNNGVHLAFFSGNEVYWKTRWEDDHRTLVCYKEGTEGENTCGGKCDPLPDVWTGLWRSGCDFPAADGCMPENALSGQISWDATNGDAILVPFQYKDLRFWRNTSITTLTSGQTATLSAGTLGYEFDWEQYPATNPPGRMTMSSTTVNNHEHKLSLYKHSSGALIFGAGTFQWSWGLDGNHDRGSSVEDISMQQATVNLFADMNVQPGSLQAGLVAASASPDLIAPTSSITVPANGASYPASNTIIISGTATDAGGGVVAGVEVSVDGGTTWHLTTGSNNWTYTWAVTATGSYNIKCRGFDDSGNMEIPANSISVTITEPVCPCSIFHPSNTPAYTNGNDGQSLEVGMKFRSSQNGYITGVRFYKATGDNGTHTGHLWSSTGTLLASVTFSGESASGWQQMNFGAPVAITANTTYVISYFSSANYYSYTQNYFTTSVVIGDLTALADGIDGPNGVYMYSPGPAFPINTYLKSNYWVDVIYAQTANPDITPPEVSSVIPVNNATGISISSGVNAIFNEPLDPSTVSISTFELRDASNSVVNGTVTYNNGTNTVTFTPASPLSYTSVYTATLKGGATDPQIKDVAGNALAANYSWSFTTTGPPPPPPNEGPGGPILVISSASNPFSRYPVEILRAEGLNEFYAMDVSAITPAILNNYDVVILGELTANPALVSMLSNWVTAGGTLIAFKPHSLLAPLLGITAVAGNLSDKYLLFNTGTGPGTGLVDQTIQFHGTADQYTLNGASSLATLYSNATTSTIYPAVTVNNVGPNGGKAIAFTYDLARSIVYTRQGNPDWAGQSRDGQAGPIRSDNLFFPDHIDFNKVAIPQADEQQRLLSNIILQYNLHRKPLPRFWFLPRKLKAAIVMTGDDHANGGTVGRFNQYLGYGNNTAQDILDWTAIRGTSYIYTSTDNASTITNAQAAAFEAQGFEIAAHVTTNCGNWASQPDLDNNYFTPQLIEFATKWPALSAPSTNRTHCIAWSDWASHPKVESLKGIHLDCNYYYWPGSWIQDRPGMFTGSGMPMRFADLDGSIIDCYQVATQLTDESGIDYSTHINSLLDKATGAEGYYGVFCANMHTDASSSTGSDIIIAAAQARQIPVISAKQMLTWLDGRNNSSYSNISWSSNTLSFTVNAATGAYKLQGMVPVDVAPAHLIDITKDGSAITYTTETIKGVSYAFFDAGSGDYVATYGVDNTGPVITNIVATPHNDGTATITWTTDEAADSRVDYGTTPGNLNVNATNAAMVISHSITVTGLSSGTVYYFRVSSADVASNSTTEPAPPAAPLSFTMPTIPCAVDITVADFTAGIADANIIVIADEDGAVSLKPAVNEEFSGTTIPSGWGEGLFNPGSTTVSGGQVTVNGTHIYSTNSFGPGTSLEFVATFNLGQFQNIGFSADQPFNANPWITIGQGGSPNGSLYARASDGSSLLLGSDLLGTPHRYKIKWNAGNFEFYVDGASSPSATISLSIASNMFVQISDVFSNDGSLSADWVRISPYATPGSFISRVFDAGALKNWTVVNWNADTPVNTTLDISVRKGNTPIPDASWSSFIPVTNGGTVGCSSRYIQYKADLATANNNITPLLKDISINCNNSSDITAPVISNLQVTADGNTGTATISWLTDEASTSVVDYGTSSNNLNLHSNNTSLVVSHTIILNGLVPGTAYYYQVSSTDCSNNTALQAIASFTVPYPITICLQDITAAQFGEGTSSSTYISPKGDGEIILSPAVAEQFSGTNLPAGWQSFAWTGSGSSTVSGGSVLVDGARLNTVPPTTNFGPGTSMEFAAIFGAGSFQHIGFGGGTDAIGSGGIYNGEDPWINFSTKNTTDQLYARTYMGTAGTTDVAIGAPGAYIGSSHLYRIEWKATSVDFYVDGILVNTTTTTIGGTMRPAISDYNTDAINIQVDWIYLSPHVSSGTFTSGTFDAGSVKNWGAANWTANIPAGTSLQLSYRVSNSSINILSQPWTAIANNGDQLAVISQFIQYKAEFSSSNNMLTPALKDISISCSNIIPVMPAVSLSPLPQTICAGTPVSFSSAANGVPDPTVQWQVSDDNSNVWNDIISATNPVYTFTPLVTDNGKKFRAVWTNTAGSVPSGQAVLTVNPIPATPVIAVVYNCDSTATLTASGCTGNLLWSTNQTIPSISVNANALYTLTQTINGCNSAIASATINLPTGLGLAISSITHINCAGNQTGSVTTAASGGTPGYQYKLDGGNFQPSATFTGLAAGSHTVTVQDANGCLRSIVFSINQPLNTEVSLGSIFSNNLFPNNGDQVNIVYNITELAGKQASPVTIRIFKPSGYDLVFDNTQTSITVFPITYTLDNTKWVQTVSTPLYDEFARTGPGGNNTLACFEKVYVSFRLLRNTQNVSTFVLNAQFRVPPGEILTNNNGNSIVMTGE